ncbi:hypothetical protein COS31_03875 [Candidatus Roizmanbacteria bacterium CG02_land_8_20_14_3_00_36_15]|uniref:Uncharacterized protein n=2 Tax=Candidatus Roizmaniibacteriota TaxID=1752723 RepID=A0A2M8KKK9_9BACT|nr:MAG: hypothetical protein COS51_02705 [Candidatus Roizmanbacteria bacterium CG03_land_8_20_14_0_80_36_21]PIV37544.1 MAG: hypothetical protein COS31_03875 [Candidatus Roizmanbacteria bacterium CG02_land_8_20_14_3_00_36_15]PIY70430.1 MAG: hypothetical protein COY89_01305 [Candidatus Roizmanbacteria bacterium CG_4_10_14_0_8_um_filter_36_36]PJA53821.1 MAG: hypothetical protein CO166_00400 [Candidatus Roizmanbacteria bacterium CG_4_9_14_3_um_filter_36_11]PJC81319.1 MAG: hypothetical protein CO007
MSPPSEAALLAEVGEKKPHKEVEENYLVIRAFAPPDFHLRGKGMIRFLRKLTEAGEMEVFERPRALDQSNYLHNIDAIPHPLFGRLEPHDENGEIGWRNSWCTTCVYNETRDENGVQVTILAHSCGVNFPQERFLRTVYSSLTPSEMSYAFLSSKPGQIHEFKPYQPKGDEQFLQIINLLNEHPRSNDEKVKLGQRLESLVFERNRLRKLMKDQFNEHLQYLDELLTTDELEKLQRIFGDYEGILEQRTAKRIIETKGKIGLKDFPYYDRYDVLTDIELAKTIRGSGFNKICMIGGGWLPISAIMYAQKTNAHITIIEKSAYRAEITQQVIQALGLQERITIINKKAELVDYSHMDIIVFAAMADPKNQIFGKASETDYPATIVLRTPFGDARALYKGFPDFLHAIRAGNVDGINHWPRWGSEVQGQFADPDGIFTLYFLDSKRGLEEP